MNSYIRFLVGAVAGPLEKSASAYPFTAEDAMEARRQFPNLVDRLEKIAGVNPLKLGKEIGSKVLSWFRKPKGAPSTKILGDIVSSNSPTVAANTIANKGLTLSGPLTGHISPGTTLTRGDVLGGGGQFGTQTFGKAVHSYMPENVTASQVLGESVPAYMPESAATFKILPKQEPARVQLGSKNNIDFNTHTVTPEGSSAEFSTSSFMPSGKVAPAPGAPVVGNGAPVSFLGEDMRGFNFNPAAPGGKVAPGAPTVKPTTAPAAEAGASSAAKSGEKALTKEQAMERNMDRAMAAAGFRARMGRMFGGKEYTPEEWAKLNALQRRNAILDWQGRGNAALGAGGTLGAFGLGGAMFSPGSSSSGVHQYSSRDAVG